MDYSIIVPAYNEEKLLPATLICLNELKHRLEPDFSGEIIVVDNNSTDNTAKLAEEYRAKVVFEPHNCIAKARNAGAKAAVGESLIFVDADTIVPFELIEKSLKTMQDKQACGGGTLIDFDEDKMPLALRFFTWLWHFHIRFFPLAAGSFVFCLKEAWQDVGGFDETVYASEEIWFSRALRRWGKKRKMPFTILDIPVVTSSRKMNQYSTSHMLVMVFFLMFYPWGLRNRKICHMWYERQ